ncbi:uncharacterized protein LOC118751595 [Rhagoletis pomonella]|uniref:uncharacterized protein LOC118751595 n=1 Tax=Rhagoletis pomonella TaxID=28610 RepID=UPI001783A8B9|nr:uncharacterized protein LOC118751595 [Rhagoletis pomonella]
MVISATTPQFKVPNLAVASPQANGQVERVNRVLKTMLGKLTEPINHADWSSKLFQVEYVINNSIHSTTGSSPIKLLFGVEQRGEIIDEFTEYIEDKVNQNIPRDLEKIRLSASEAIEKKQEYNLSHFLKNSVKAKEYKVGDFVVIRNVDTVVGTNKKFFPKYKGPYVVFLRHFWLRQWAHQSRPKTRKIANVDNSSSAPVSATSAPNSVASAPVSAISVPASATSVAGKTTSVPINALSAASGNTTSASKCETATVALGKTTSAATKSSNIPSAEKRDSHATVADVSSAAAPTVAQTEITELEVQLLKKLRILKLQKEIKELEEGTVTNNFPVKFSDIENALTKFSGDDGADIQKWITDFEYTAKCFGCDEKTKPLLARRMLTGSAQLFTKMIDVNSWCDLKRSLCNEFKRPISVKDIFKQLESRVWLKTETLTHYVLCMQQIAQKAT